MAQKINIGGAMIRPPNVNISKAPPVINIAKPPELPIDHERMAGVITNESQKSHSLDNSKISPVETD